MNEPSEGRVAGETSGNQPGEISWCDRHRKEMPMRLYYSMSSSWQKSPA